MKILDQILVIQNGYYPDTSHKRWRRVDFFEKKVETYPGNTSRTYLRINKYHA